MLPQYKDSEDQDLGKQGGIEQRLEVIEEMLGVLVESIGSKARALSDEYASGQAVGDLIANQDGRRLGRTLKRKAFAMKKLATIRMKTVNETDSDNEDFERYKNVEKVEQ